LTYYNFVICTDGTYQLNALNVLLSSLRHGSNDAIQQGVGQANVIAVVANGTNLDLYVNGVHLANISNDKSSSGGQIGLIVSSQVSSSTPAEAAFNDAKLWTL